MPELIPITAISPNPQPRLRRLKPDKVQGLAKSIQEIGLQSPISLRAHSVMAATPCNHNGKLYSVVAGAHRLEACRSLGWKEIPAIIVNLGDLQSLLWEIDENLVRAELTELERGEHIRTRKMVYEQLYPETKHGGAPANHGGAGGKVAKSATLPQALSFVKDTAEKTGMSERAIRQSIERAKTIDDSVKETIRDIPEIADKGVELDALAAVEPEDQKAAVEAVKSGKARNVREATNGAKKRKRKTKPAPSDQEIVRRAMVAAVKHCQKKTGQRLAVIQITCDGSAIDVAVTFHR